MENHNNQEYVIGIDLGTGSCKTVILGKSGDILGLSTANYKSENISSKWKEQDPR